MGYSSQVEITFFLTQYKFFMNTAGGFDFIERPVNMKSLAELGLTIEQAEEVVYELTYVDYTAGPEEDIDYPNHSIWTFGYDINGTEVYIKLSDNFKFGKAKCLSFHISEYPMAYPYKN